MYDNIVFAVTSWEENLFISIRQSLLSLGVPDSRIVKISERTSRPKSLNKVWNSYTNPSIDNGIKYIAFIDEDVVIRDRHVFSRFTEILESPGNESIAGVIANPKLFSEGQSMFEIAHDLPPETPWQQSLTECTSTLVSLNLALFRIDLTQRFNEDMFGNQVFDVCFGLDLAKDGKRVVTDKATLILARANNYLDKSLSYHAVVARNLHIFMRKWTNVNNWNGVASYNASHDNEIPSIEELTHGSEMKQMQYCMRYNPDGLTRCYLQPRLSGLIPAAIYVQNIENGLKNIQHAVEYSIPFQGALPIFNLK